VSAQLPTDLIIAQYMIGLNDELYHRLTKCMRCLVIIAIFGKIYRQHDNNHHCIFHSSVQCHTNYLLASYTQVAGDQVISYHRKILKNIIYNYYS